MRRKYIRDAIVQTANIINKSSTSKCITTTDFCRGMLKDPYLVKMNDIWNSFSKGSPFIESGCEDIPVDSLPPQHR